jgi:hypothetical protein
MAIWQYTVELIPKRALPDLGAFGFITLDDYDNLDYWKNFDLQLEYFDLLTSGLKRSKSWSDEIVLFGDNDSTCIQIFLDLDKISGIDVQIDIRTNYSSILNAVIEFCQMKDFVILDNLELLNLNETTLTQHIKKSAQLDSYNKLFNEPY